MNWEQRRAYMKRYRVAVLKKYELIEELESLHTDVTHITPILSGMPTNHGGGNEKIPKAVERMIDRENQLAAQIAQCEKLLAEIMAVVESVEDERQQLIIRKHFIAGKTFQEIADEMHNEVSWTKELYYRGMMAAKFPE